MLRWVGLLVVAYLIWSALLFMLQRRMLFPRHLISPSVGAARPNATLRHLVRRRLIGLGVGDVGSHRMA